MKKIVGLANVGVSKMSSSWYQVKEENEAAAGATSDRQGVR